MSGLEVLGAVLGGMSLLASALEHDRDVLSTIQRWRKYDREKKSLIRNLQTEKALFQNICEKLLLGLVRPSHIKLMIETPFGIMWNNDVLKRKIRARLDNSYDVFESTVEDMKSAVEEMRRRLDLVPEGKVNLTETSFIVKHFKRAAFTISRSNYEGLLSTIRGCIASLGTLTDQNVYLEPKRLDLSQVKLLTVLRDISLGLYQALRRSFACNCNHDVNLKLATRASDIIYGENEYKVLQDLDLHLVLSYPPGASARVDGTMRRRWEEVRILAVPLDKEMAPCIEKEPGTGTASLINRPNKGKGVNFQSASFSTSSAAATLVEACTVSASLSSLLSTTNSNTGLPNLENTGLPNLEPISNLCERLREAQKQKQTECYGFIAEEQSKKIKGYNVYPSATRDGKHQESLVTVSLTQALQRTNKAPPLRYKDKIRLAVVISTSVLQLFNTPWLPHTLSTDDILFIRKENGCLYDDAFVMKRMPGTDRAASVHNSSSIRRNPTLLSLGCVLIELLLEQSLNAQGHVSAGFNLEEYYIAAQSLLPRVRHESQNYFSAVSRCLDGELHQHPAGLDNEDFRQDVYSGIVALLKKDLDVLM